MKLPHPETIAGAGIFVLTVMVFGMLFVQPALADNDLFKTLSQAIVVQGLIGLAMASWFTKSRKELPQDVTVTNAADNPVPTTEGDT